jgi:antitoxin (DNA-binding transcriptional repressor) of toxin-antitoxin stability system
MQHTLEYQFDELHLPTLEVQPNFAEWLTRTKGQQERSILTENGQPVAALIPLEDLIMLQQLEDRLDYQDGIEALDENGENISLETLKREVGWEVK